ncbi:hypothetical protein PM082_018113 [Marasmius tenuissimus]|nr:hypothetical protein PM082_018113 [Marasmius tenuissimus]
MWCVEEYHGHKSHFNACQRRRWAAEQNQAFERLEHNEAATSVTSPPDFLASPLDLPQMVGLEPLDPPPTPDDPFLVFDNQGDPDTPLPFQNDNDDTFERTESLVPSCPEEVQPTNGSVSNGGSNLPKVWGSEILNDFSMIEPDTSSPWDGPTTIGIDFKPDQDDILIESHPSSRAPPQILPFKRFLKDYYRPRQASPRPPSEPWKPFSSKFDFEVAEFALKAHLNKDLTDQLLTLLHRSRKGETTSFTSYRSVQNA